MALTKEEQRAWLAQHTEEIIDPGREKLTLIIICGGQRSPCLPFGRSLGDTESGHRIVKLFSWSAGQSTELMALSILMWLEKRSSLEMQRSPVGAKVRLRSRHRRSCRPHFRIRPFARNFGSQ